MAVSGSLDLRGGDGLDAPNTGHLWLKKKETPSSRLFIMLIKGLSSAGAAAPVSMNWLGETSLLRLGCL